MGLETDWSRGSARETTPVRRDMGQSQVRGGWSVGVIVGRGGWLWLGGRVCVWVWVGGFVVDVWVDVSVRVSCPSVRWHERVLDGMSAAY